MRRFVVFSLVAGLGACTAILGSFEVEPGVGPPEAGSDSRADTASPVDAAKDVVVADAPLPKDAGADADADAGVVVISGCVPGIVAEESFSNGRAWGCAGKVTYPNRATLCRATCVACTAAQWNSFHGVAVPGHHYWVEDSLSYSGTFPGTAEGECSVSSVGVSNCGADTPMRVCKPGVFPTNGTADPESNTCNWWACRYGVSLEKDHYGGCAGNLTAGTLCCCP